MKKLIAFTLCGIMTFSSSIAVFANNEEGFARACLKIHSRSL